LVLSRGSFSTGSFQLFSSPYTGFLYNTFTPVFFLFPQNAPGGAGGRARPLPEVEPPPG